MTTTVERLRPPLAFRAHPLVTRERLTAAMQAHRAAAAASVRAAATAARDAAETTSAAAHMADKLLELLAAAPRNIDA